MRRWYAVYWSNKVMMFVGWILCIQVCVSVIICTIYTDAHVQRIMYMYTVQCTPYNVQCTICPNMNNARTKYFVRRTMYVVRWTICTVQCTPYNVQCIICLNMNNTHTNYVIRWTLYVIRWTLFNVQCTLNNVRRKGYADELVCCYMWRWCDV